MMFCYCWSLFFTVVKRRYTEGQWSSGFESSTGAFEVWMWIKDVDNYIDFEEAYHLYSSFVQFFCPEKQAFRDKLLDEIHGLPVYVITQSIMCKSFVALKNSSNMEKYLVDFTNSRIDDENDCEIHLVGTLKILPPSLFVQGTKLPPPPPSPKKSSFNPLGRNKRSVPNYVMNNSFFFA